MQILCDKTILSEINLTLFSGTNNLLVKTTIYMKNVRKFKSYKEIKKHKIYFFVTKCERI